MGDIITRAYFQSCFDKNRIAELINDGGGPQGGIIDDAISAAEAKVQNYLSKQYTLVQLQADASIKRAVADVVMYALELRRSDISVGMQTIFEATMVYLKNLIEGDAKLNAVEQVLPRITNTNAADVFEESGYFTGMPSTENE